MAKIIEYKREPSIEQAYQEVVTFGSLCPGAIFIRNPYSPKKAAKEYVYIKDDEGCAVNLETGYNREMDEEENVLVDRSATVHLFVNNA